MFYHFYTWQTQTPYFDIDKYNYPTCLEKDEFPTVRYYYNDPIKEIENLLDSCGFLCCSEILGENTYPRLGWKF